MGSGKDETGEYIALVLVYENKTDIEEAILQLETNIKIFNLFCDEHKYSINDSIYNADIQSEGRVILAKLYTTKDCLWKYWFLNMWEVPYYNEITNEIFDELNIRKWD